MHICKVNVLCVLLLLCSATVSSEEQNVKVVSSCWLNSLEAKVDDLQHRLFGMESAIQEQREYFDHELVKVAAEIQALGTRTSFVMKRDGEIRDQQLAGTNRSIEQMNQTIIQKLSEVTGVLYELSDPAVSNLTVIQSLMSKLLTEPMTNSNHSLVKLRSCREEPSKNSGKYLIQPTRYDEPYLTYCEQTVFGGGWQVFQYRYDGAVDFFRNWTEYREGFGSVDGEFWLGLERLHRLTTAQPHELLVELKDFNGNYSYARYDMFQIGSEKDHYALEELGNFTGTAVDALNYHRGMNFSTADRDNDGFPRNCASELKGAWWYNACHHSNLNGPYTNSNYKQAMDWATSNYKTHAYSRMSIRKI